MATFIWLGLAYAWIWHAIDLFREVEPSELPPRARRRVLDDENQPARAWVSEGLAHARSAAR